MRSVANESKIPVGALLVGKYKVTREIGRGGMAAVYEAEHLSLGKKVAVKVLAQELAASTIVIERFFREARAAASIKSPHIVDIYDSGRLEDGRPFICMEMLEGESLYDRMARIRLIDPETTVRIISHCAKGLLKAHAAGIVHRDLKPENIFITHGEEGEIAKILDFGLAKFYEPVAADQKSARLTREGAVFGTPAYMSPEQVKGQGSVDHRADLWALGCMAFECLIGRPVWNTDQGVAMTFAAIATSPIPTPSKLRPDLPLSFDEWFKKALERDPDDRFQTAKELAEALQRAFGSPSASFVASSDFGDPRTGSGPQHFASGPVDLSSGRMYAQGDGGADATVPSSPMRLPPSFPSDPSTNVFGGGVASDRSPRPVNLSANEMPPMARSSQMTSSQAVHTPPSPLRWVLSSVALAGASVLAFVVYANVLRPQVFVPVVQSVATMPSADVSAHAVEPQPAPGDPKWLQAVSDGQKLFADGDAPGALKRFKDAQEMGGGATARAYFEQVKAAQSGTGPCKEVAFGHPRVGIAGGIGRPTVATVGKGALVSWTDDHEQAGHDHAYAVLVDEAARGISPVRDLTPEGAEIMRPALLTVGDRAVLLYWDKSGREAGVHVRWIDAEGRIGGSSVLVGAGRPGSYWPAMDRGPDGFYVTWQDDRDREGDDIFFRKLSNDLEPIGQEVRATDYIGISGHFVNARGPSVAVASNTLFIAYKVEREPLHTIYRMRLPLNGPETATGLDERTSGTPAPPQPKGKAGTTTNIDRELGDVVVVNEDKLPGDAPATACGREGCFVAWHGERGGAFAALMEPAEGKVLWRKRLADKGSHPALGVGVDGSVAVTYFEAGRLKLAPLTRDGVGAASSLGKVSGEQPRPWLAAGRVKGEWYLAWQDAESTHTEAYVARVVCAGR